MIDGVDFTDPVVGMARARFSQEAISEYRVIANRFDTEIGSAGGALSIVTKSGTNDLHGSAFGFFRDASLRAKGELDLKKVDSSRQQFGGTIGGPITKARVHFVGSFEQVSENNFVLFRPGGAYASQAADLKVPFDQSLFYAGLDTRLRFAATRRRTSPTPSRCSTASGSPGCTTRTPTRSGGQRQRVGSGRALMQNPDLLLVDEPTASLDPRTARQIMRLIRSLAQERSTPALVNIHDVALAHGFADRVIGLKAGKLVFDGPSSGLTPEVLTEIYGAEDWSQTIRRDEEEEAPA